MCRECWFCIFFTKGQSTRSSLHLTKSGIQERARRLHPSLLTAVGCRSGGVQPKSNRHRRINNCEWPTKSCRGEESDVHPRASVLILIRRSLHSLPIPTDTRFDIRSIRRHHRINRTLLFLGAATFTVHDHLIQLLTSDEHLISSSRVSNLCN